jgi:Holliday junction DNA helicase RuvA
MIGRLTGRIVDCTPGQVLLDVTGVGYNLQIPLSTYYNLSSAGGSKVSLHVHTHVREDALQLFGFSSLDERAAFEQLISISGVGPRLALAVLSGIGVDELRETVARRDRERLQAIPGVGKKTAERVLLELRDKMGLRDDDGTHADGFAPAAALHGVAALEADATSALINLGYSRAVAHRAVSKASAEQQAETPSLQTILKSALRGLVRRS